MDHYDLSNKPLQGSDLQRITGISRSSIHSYIKKGLLSEPVRGGKTVAYYSSVHLDELEEIKKLRKLGYPLPYIKDILDEKRRERELKPKKQENPAKKREKILEKAVEIFSINGYHKTKMDDIAKAVGLSKNSLYLYFENKEMLFLECADRVLDSMAADIMNKVKDEKDVLKRLVKTSEVILKSYPHLFEILTSIDYMVEADPELRDKGRGIYERMVSMILNDSQEAISKGGLPHFPDEMDKVFLGYFMIMIVKAFHGMSQYFNEYSTDDLIKMADYFRKAIFGNQ